MVFTMRHLLTMLFPQAEKKLHPHLENNLSEPTALAKRLAAALPACTILPTDTVSFQRSTNAYWAQQECEVPPACVVRPHNDHDVSTAVTILKREHDDRRANLRAEDHIEPIFAVRGGGHSPVPGAATIRHGVVIDLGFLNEIVPSADGASVTVGAGATWGDVSKSLDKIGFAVVGGRSSAVGTGGLTLGGGLSYFSPRFGLVCDNVLAYEAVLASGSLVKIDESTNRDLFTALKGSCNNFAIVTRFVYRMIRAETIWSGNLYSLSFQAPNALKYFHYHVDLLASKARPSVVEDEQDYSAGPVACFSYIQPLRLKALTIQLQHTMSPPATTGWPAYWKHSPFASMFRLWSTCKHRTITSATDENSALNPPGRRQIFATTTIKNDPATISAAYTAYDSAITPIRQAGVNGMVWTLVLQPLLPLWGRKGLHPNPLGLDQGGQGPLVIVSFTVNWNKEKDDALVHELTRRAIDEIEATAGAMGTRHPYRAMNYCAEWQQPFEGYGEENLRILKDAVGKWDPDEFFQKGCTGKFKVGIR
ncbi:MAG: hypothetical protein Q9170_007777 [Blastenia crenularia]